MTNDLFILFTLISGIVIGMFLTMTVMCSLLTDLYYRIIELQKRIESKENKENGNNSFNSK